MDRAAAWREIETAMAEEARGAELADALCSMGWRFRNRGLTAIPHDGGAFLVTLPKPTDEAKGYAA